MIGTAELAIFFQWIFVILVIFGLFGLITILPFFLVKISEGIAYYFCRRRFVKDLTIAMKKGIIQDLSNVESIFLISFLGIPDFPFVLNNELKHFIGLINIGYWDTFDKEIDFRNIQPNEIQRWRELIGKIIESNQKRLNYADLPLDDRVAFKEIFDYFDCNNEMKDQDKKFIQTRLLEVKRKMLKKNDDLRKSQFINYGAFFASLLGIILTLVFGLKLIGG